MAATNTLEYKKELKRWSNFIKTVSAPDPRKDFTPRQVVWKKNKATLYHYPAVNKKYAVPVFFVYSLINRPNILDFGPGSSVIEGVVNSGYDVYLLDWGIPEYEDKDITIEDYVDHYIRNAVKRAIRHAGAKEISLVGYCLGGTLAAMYAATADEPIKNLVVATVPIDYTEAAMPDKWAEDLRRDDANQLESLIEAYGTIPAEVVENMFLSITTPVYYSPYVLLLSRADDEVFVEKWHRMNSWTKGHVPITGGALKQLNDDLHKANKLIKGEFMIHGKKADLANIDMSLLTVSAKYDHLIPESQSLPLMDAVSSEDKTYMLVETGHVALALSGKFTAILTEWLSERSEKIV